MGPLAAKLKISDRLFQTVIAKVTAISSTSGQKVAQQLPWIFFLKASIKGLLLENGCGKQFQVKIRTVTSWAIAEAGWHSDVLKQLHVAKGSFSNAQISSQRKTTTLNTLLKIYFHQFGLLLRFSHFKRNKEGPSNSDFNFEE